MPVDHSRPTWPVSLVDKHGRRFSVCLGSDDGASWDSLTRMYQTFEPKECAQGLPPCTEERRRAWLEDLRGQTLNLVAVAEGRAVGHAVLLDMEPGRSCEYLIFVHQEHQNRGIGTALTRIGRALAEDLGYGRVWLTVEMINPRAIHVYEKVGFRLIGAPELEREMALDLPGAQRR